MSFQTSANKSLPVREMRGYFMGWCSVLSIIGIVSLLLFMDSKGSERLFMREVAIIVGVATAAWVLATITFFIWHAIDSYAKRGSPRAFFPVPDQHRFG